MVDTRVSIRSVGALLAAAFAATACAQTTPYDLTFEDEFDGALLDQSVWEIDPDRPNVHVEDSTLQLFTTRTGPESWATGNVRSRPAAHRQRFGRWEARFKIGNSSGLNNAFWINSPRELIWQTDGVTPQNHDRMEIDIQEGHYPGKVANNIHNWDNEHYGFPSSIQSGLDLSADYHVYAFEWDTDNTMRWLFDEQVVYELDPTVINAFESTIPMQVLFSTKVFTNGWPGPVTPETDDTVMIIDWVRAFDQAGYTGAVSNNWGTATNWGSPNYPQYDEAAVFNRPVPAGREDVVIASTSGTIDKAVREVLFDQPGIPAFTLSARSDTPNGKLRVGSPGVGAITINYPVTQTQTINMPVVAESRLTLSNFALDPTVRLVLTQGIEADPAGRLVAALGTGVVEVHGDIASSVGDMNVHGGGELLLLGTASPSGVMHVTDGTLTINGRVESPASIHVGLNGELRGTGTIAAPITVDDNGRFAPGAPTGMLTLEGDLTVTNNSAITIVLDGGLHGSLFIDGDLDVTAPIEQLVIEGAALGGVSYDLITYTGSMRGSFWGISGVPASHRLAIVPTGNGATIIRLEPKCPADLDLSGDVDLLDVFEFIDRASTGDAAADLDRDGAVTIFDQIEFLARYDTGCP